MSIALGTIYGDIRLKLDALRLDGQGAIEVFTGLQEKLANLGSVTQETGATMTAAFGDAKTAAQELGTGAEEAGSKIEGAGAKIRAAGDEAEGAGRKAKESGFNFLEFGKHLLEFTGAMIGTQLVFGIWDKLAESIHGVFERATEAQKAEQEMNTLLETTKGKAGLTADALLNYADALSKTTAFSKDVILHTQNLLLTFTNIGQKAFPEATTAALNMAQVLGIDSKNAAILLGKALNDPVKGVTALTRVGVSLDEQQKKAIKTAVAQGDTYKAQKIILDELHTEFGKQADDYGKTLPGMLARLGHSWDDMADKIGKQVIPAIQQMLVNIGPLIIDLAERIPDAVKFVGDKIAELSGDIHQFAAFLQSDSPAADLLKGALLTLGFVLAWVTWSILPPLTINTGIFAGAMAALDTVLAPITLPVLLVAAALAALIIGFKLAYDHIKPFHEWVDRTREVLAQLLQNGLKGVQAGLAQLGDWIGKGVAWFQRFWTEVGPKILPVLREIASFLGEKIGQAIAFLTPYVQEAIKQFQKFWTEIAPNLLPALRTIGIVLGAVAVAALALPIAIGVAAYLIITHWKQVQAFLAPALLFLRDLFTAVWPGIAQVIAGVWNVIVGVIKVAWAVVSGIIRIGLALLSGDWSGAWHAFQDMLGGVWDGILQIIRGALQIVGGLLSALAGYWGTILGRVGSFLLGIVTGAFNAILNAVLTPFRAIGAAFVWLYDHNVYVKMLVDFIHEKFAQALAVVLVIWSAITAYIGARIEAARAVVVSVATAIWSFLSGIWNNITAGVQRAFAFLVSIIGSQLGRAKDTAVGGARSILQPFLDLGGLMLNAGRNLIQMLINGILGMVGNLKNTLGNIAGNIASFLGFHSPTKEGPGKTADQWAPNLMKMYARGIDDGTGQVAGAAGRAAAALQDGLLGVSPGAGSLALTGAGLAGGPLGGAGVHHHHTTNIDVTVEVQPGDETEGSPADVGAAFGASVGSSLGATLAQYGYHRVN